MVKNRNHISEGYVQHTRVSPPAPTGVNEHAGARKAETLSVKTYCFIINKVAERVIPYWLPRAQLVWAKTTSRLKNDSRGKSTYSEHILRNITFSRGYGLFL